jgi:hypothetical protein
MADTNGRLVELMAEMVIEMKGFRAELNSLRDESKSSLNSLRSELREEFRDGLGHLASEIGTMRVELRSEFQVGLGNISNEMSWLRKETQTGLANLSTDIVALRNDVSRLETIAEEQSGTLRVISDKLNRIDNVERRVDALEQIVFKK